MKQAKTKKPTAADNEKKKKRGEKGQNKEEKKLRMLILEDNPADAELMERQLKKDGIAFVSRRVESKSNYLKALKTFHPDLILADFKLPKFNALQALELRNKMAPQTPFIIVTGTISEATAVECMKQGADDYLLKDRLARLAEAIRHSLANHCLLAEKMMTDKLIEKAARKWTITFDAINDGIALLAVDQTVMQANRAFADLVNKPFKEIIGKKCYELMHSDQQPDPYCPFKKMLKSKKRESMELVIAERTFAIVVDPIANADGAITGAAHIITDISERKRAEEQIRASLLEKEILLKEIHHRVKNNLQVISGLLTLQAAQIGDERLQRVLKESQGRIWTMALIHQTLYQSGNLADIDMADYIRSLTGNLLSSHAQVAMPPNVSFDLLPVRLVIDKAIPLALIINELVTNSMKHAFPDGQPGEIRISLQERRGVKFFAQPEEADTDADGKNTYLFELTVSDNGIGLPAGFDPKNQKSLGLQLVTMLTTQLGGALAFASSGGTSVAITFNSNEKN